MALLHPSQSPLQFAASAGAAAEREVLRVLEIGLPPIFDVFHGVAWSSGWADSERHGEVDVVVVNAAGDLLLIEVKSGSVDFGPDGIYKRYPGQVRNATLQVKQQYGAFRARLASAGLDVQLHHLLVLPDVRVPGSGSVGWPRERIVDSAGMSTLVSRVRDLLGAGLPAPSVRPRVLDFLADRFHVVPDVSTMAGRVESVSARLAAGLATWVPRIETPGGVIRVVGTAGSGKTQLALGLLREADRAGLQAAYLCFNRPLADHMARLLPVRVAAETFHELAARLARRRGEAVDFSDPQAYDRLARSCLQALAVEAPDLDLLVIDEGQDLQPEWVQALMGRVREPGRAVLMEDEDQQLYPDRTPYEIAGATTIRSRENFRTPCELVRTINMLGLAQAPVDACCPHAGDPPDPIVHDDGAVPLEATEQAVRRCLDRGFALEDIAVISLQGLRRSAVLQADRLGPWPLRRFSGRYDAGGTAEWTEGVLLVESVRRFKGQAAPAVVLTECDFDALTPLVRRLLFVGLTRARLHLEWVLSRRAGAVLAEVLNG